MSLEITYRTTKSLIPYARNSRTHSDGQVAQIAASIKEFGFTNPVLIDEEDGIIAGHGRVKAAELLRQSEVPCIILRGLTKTQKQAYVIADNKMAMNAGWDTNMLSLEMQDLKAMEFDLDLIGFNNDELEALLNSEIVPEEGLTDPDEVPENVDTKCKPGDLWILGNHKLLCGDSTNLEDVEKLMGGAKGDMVWTDPPYNVNYEGKTNDALKIKNDSMEDGKFREFLRTVFANMSVLSNPGAAIYVAHADSEGYNFRGAIVETGWLLKQCLIWVKSALVMGRQDYHWKHEPILYGWKDGASHNWYSDRKQTTVLNFDRPNRNADHPTMKPVELVEYCMGNSSLPKDVVLDLFGGSGTTMIAAERLGRSSRLMEIDPRYCDVIIRRWENFTGLTAELADA